MNRYAWALLALFCSISGCSKREPKEEQLRDYVLIEFASRLEEDYHRLHPYPGMPAPKGSPAATPSQ